MALAEVIQRWAESQPERIALSCEGVETTWRRFWNRIERASARLAGEWGVGPGARVAYLGYNGAEELILLYALARIGAILVPLNYRQVEAEWCNVAADAGATHLIHDLAFRTAGLALAQASGLRDFAAEALIATACAHRPRFDAQPGATPVLLVYTSGTSGKPKGVLHDQDGLLWNAAASIAAHDMTSRDHVLTALPLFHVGGLCIQTLPALTAGATVTLHPRFDAARWLAEVATGRISLSLMVPATLQAVIDHPHFKESALDSLRLIMAGSSTIPLPLIEAFHARGIPVGQVYGSTETGPVSIVLRAGDALRKAGFAGFAALHSEIRLTDSHGGDVERGCVGEIWVRGRNVARGYWQAGGPVPFADGWFRSGDLALQDGEGCYRVVGRAKDMIISGGENIYPAELEGILAGQEGVLDAAVVGLPDAQWGETPVAAVVLRAGVPADAAAILACFEGRIARYKYPRHVCFVEGLPKNAMGKVQKAELAERLKRSLTLSGALALPSA